MSVKNIDAAEILHKYLSDNKYDHRMRTKFSLTILFENI